MRIPGRLRESVCSVGELAEAIGMEQSAVSHQLTLREQHAHGHDPADDGRHGGDAHSHGLVDRSIVRSRQGVRAVSISLAVLGAAALVQVVIFVLSGSVALLADLIHNFGDALTAVPLGIAFF